MQKKKIAFVGAGNMAESLISGLVSNGYQPDLISASDLSSEKLSSLHACYGVHISENNHKAITGADVVIFAVKPQALAAVIEELAFDLQDLQPLIISIAAGARVHYISHCLGKELSVVRCMPNLPALLQSGAIALFANAQVSAFQRDLAESIMRSVGVTVWLDDEKYMDTVTALSGSGPAYFFFIMEAFEQEAVAQGLSKEIAHLLTVQTALGASRMALESKEALSVLRERVTSPGGTTEQALKVFTDSKLREILARGMHAAKERSAELASLLEG
jgi:pyrroline-5-carboxylate reductase